MSGIFLWKGFLVLKLIIQLCPTKKNRDGQPMSQRRRSSAETASSKHKSESLLVNNDNGIPGLPFPEFSERLKKHNEGMLDPNVLKDALNKLKAAMDSDDKVRSTLDRIDDDGDGRGSSRLSHQRPSAGHLSDASASNHSQAAQQRAFADDLFKKMSNIDEDNDQDILDQHVSRVFSPQYSPGVITPCSMAPRRRAPLPADFTSLPVERDQRSTTANHAIKHSKSTPVDQSTMLSRRMSNTYGSMNFDSGISMYSDVVCKPSRSM